MNDRAREFNTIEKSLLISAVPIRIVSFPLKED